MSAWSAFSFAKPDYHWCTACSPESPCPPGTGWPVCCGNTIYVFVGCSPDMWANNRSQCEDGTKFWYAVQYDTEKISPDRTLIWPSEFCQQDDWYRNHHCTPLPAIVPGTWYAWKINSFNNEGGSNRMTDGNAPFFFQGGASCTVTISANPSAVTVGGNGLLSANVTTVPAGTSYTVDWTKSNNDISFSQTTGSPINFTGELLGETQVTANVTLAGGSGSCTTNTNISVMPPSWWQVSGGDIYAGSINDQIPSSYETACSRYININQ